MLSHSAIVRHVLLALFRDDEHTVLQCIRRREIARPRSATYEEYVEELRQHEKALRRCLSALELDKERKDSLDQAYAHRRSADGAFVDVVFRTVLAFLADGKEQSWDPPPVVMRTKTPQFRAPKPLDRLKVTEWERRAVRDMW